MGRTTSHTGTSLLDFCTTSACLRATCTWLFPVPRDQYMSRLVPTCQALQPFSLEPFLPCSPRPPALPILTVPALAPLVPPDKDVAKKHQDQQAQPDTQDSPEHVDGLLSCKAEGEEALQTQEAGRSDHARVGKGELWGWDTALQPLMALGCGGTALSEAVVHHGTIFAASKAGDL